MITCSSKNLVFACSTVQVRVAADVAEGLVYLHELPDGVVGHRDVNPTNVLLNNGRQAKIADFGVLRVMQSEGSHVSIEIRYTTQFFFIDDLFVALKWRQFLVIILVGFLYSGRY